VDSISPVSDERKLSERVQRELERLILSGKLKVSEQLPTEADLSKAFGVSRTVIREAIHRLEAQGLVQARVGSGSFVTPFAIGQVSCAMTRFAALNPGREVFLQLLDLRLVLECETAERLARSGDKAAISRATDALRRMREHRRDPVALATADMDFHLAIAEAAGNPFFAAILEPLKKSGEQFGASTYVSDEVAAAAILEHERVLRAIRKGDASAARVAMRGHIMRSRERYLALLEQGQQSKR
jgi:DNA-binding FadR family transcriptional regulator